jgi:hypothetical protein
MAYEIAYTAKTNQRHNYATVATEANQTELAQWTFWIQQFENQM